MKSVDFLKEDILKSGVPIEELTYLVDFIGSDLDVNRVRGRLRSFLTDGDPKNEHPIPKSIREKEMNDLLPWDSLMSLAKIKYYSKGK